MREIAVAITVDDRDGLAFNKRRQSRDKLLIADLCHTTVGDIYVTSYSAPLFEEYNNRIKVVTDPLRECPDDGVCFVEMMQINNHLRDIKTLIIYHWNRIYPHDISLDLDPCENGFKLISSTEFVGKSHDKITKDIYNRS